MEQSIAQSEVTTRVGPLTNLAPLLSSLGCDPDPIFRRAGFDPEEFQNPDHRLPYLRGSRLLADCVHASGCEHLGLLLGLRAEPSHLGVAGFLIRAAATTEHALKSLVENLDLHDEAAAVTLEIGANFTSLGYTMTISGASATEQICDLSVVLMYKVMTALCGEGWTAASVRLRRRRPDAVAPYRRFFVRPSILNRPSVRSFSPAPVSNRSHLPLMHCCTSISSRKPGRYTACGITRFCSNCLPPLERGC